VVPGGVPDGVPSGIAAILLLPGGVPGW